MNSRTHSCRFSNIQLLGCFWLLDTCRFNLHTLKPYLDSSISTTVSTFSVQIKFNHFFYHFNILTRRLPPCFYDFKIVLFLIVSNSQNLTTIFSEAGLFNVTPFKNGYHVISFCWFYFQSPHSMRWRLVSRCWCWQWSPVQLPLQ